MKKIDVNQEVESGRLETAISNTLNKDSYIANWKDTIITLAVTDDAVYRVSDIFRFNYTQKCTLRKDEVLTKKINRNMTAEWNAMNFEGRA